VYQACKGKDAPTFISLKVSNKMPPQWVWQIRFTKFFSASDILIYLGGQLRKVLQPILAKVRVS
jgi:hypothetical protein